MSAKHIPIGADLYQDLLVFLRERQTAPLVSERQRATDLGSQLAQAGTLACEYESHIEMLGAELIESINYATGRQIETQLTPATVAQAKAALSETVPALGANVIPLPRTPSRDTQASIEAAANKAFADAPPPLAGLVIVDGRPLSEPLDLYQMPASGQMMRLPNGERIIVQQVCWVGSKCAEIHAVRTWPERSSKAVSHVG